MQLFFKKMKKVIKNIKFFNKIKKNKEQLIDGVKMFLDEKINNIRLFYTCFLKNAPRSASRKDYYTMFFLKVLNLVLM